MLRVNPVIYNPVIYNPVIYNPVIYNSVIHYAISLTDYGCWPITNPTREFTD